MPDAGDFGDVERTFETQTGEQVSKVRTRKGGVLYYSEVEGQINQQRFSTKSSQRREVNLFRTKDIEDIESTELSDRYQTEQTYPIGDLEPGTIDRERVKQQNMFVGFLLQDDTPDNRVEAVREYEEMQQRLRQAESRDEIEDIKGDYNIGGTP